MAAGPRAGAVESVPVTGAFPAAPRASLVQRRRSVAPAAQARLEAVLKLLADEVQGDGVDAGV